MRWPLPKLHSTEVTQAPRARQELREQLQPIVMQEAPLHEVHASVSWKASQLSTRYNWTLTPHHSYQQPHPLLTEEVHDRPQVTSLSSIHLPMELLQAKQPRQTSEAAVYLNKITKAIVQITILRAGTSKAQHRPGVTETVPMPEDEQRQIRSTSLYRASRIWRASKHYNIQTE